MPSNTRIRKLLKTWFRDIIADDDDDDTMDVDSEPGMFLFLLIAVETYSPIC